MDPSNQADKRPFIEIKKELDRVTLSPEKRGALVWKVLKEHTELTSWDLICFCLIYITKCAATLYPFMKPHAQYLSTTINLAHYYAPDELGILPKVENNELLKE